MRLDIEQDQGQVGFPGNLEKKIKTYIIRLPPRCSSLVQLLRPVRVRGWRGYSQRCRKCPIKTFILYSVSFLWCPSSLFIGTKESFGFYQYEVNLLKSYCRTRYEATRSLYSRSKRLGSAAARPVVATHSYFAFCGNMSY